MEQVIIEYLNKKTSSATIRNGVLLMRISNRIPQYLQTQQIEHFKKRFAKHFTQEQTEAQTINTGSCFNFYGLLQLWINLQEAENNKFSIKIDQTAPFLNIKIPSNFSRADLHKKVCQFVSKKLTPELIHTVTKINNATVKQPLDEINFKYMQSRWGHCNFRNRTITLSTKLALVPKECFEYVVIHELCHLIEPNHSANFWSLVAKFDPAYKKHQKRLIAWQ